MPLERAARKPSAGGIAASQIVAFDGDRLIESGDLVAVVRAAKAAESRGLRGALLAFDILTSEPVELDLRGSADEAVARLVAPVRGIDSGTEADAEEAADFSRGPGRPRLGVVGREVTLLPRHWDWLSAQPGGASAALRRLVELARSANAGRDRRRRAQEYAYRFLSAMLGDAPGFEEATRALFAGDAERFTARSERWPIDLRDHARRLAAAAFTS